MAVVYDEIKYAVDDPTAVITLHRPDALNAWTTRMAAEVRHAVDRAEKDRRVVGIVITGSGRGFCAGADLKMLAGVQEAGVAPPREDDGLEVARDPSLSDDFAGEFTWLMATRKPVIAAINGPVAGMAIPLVLCCDVRFMAEDAPLLTAFAHRGLVAEWGIAWLLPRIVGPGRALDLLFTSRRLTGREAETIGLVEKALPAEEVLAHSVGYVQALAERSSPRSLAIMKRQVYEQLAGAAPLGPSESEARRLMLESFTAPDLAEGLASFTEKRPPRFERIGEPDS